MGLIHALYAIRYLGPERDTQGYNTITIMHPPPPQNDENRCPSSSSSSKMFSSLPPLHAQSSPFGFNQNLYTPSKPSPLSSSPLTERDENASHSFTMSSPPPPTTNIFSAQIYGNPRDGAKSTGKRLVKKNPLIHRDEKDGGRETRRKLFLKRVREDSEDKRWDKKGGDDELLRSIYLSDHKRNIGKNLQEDRAYEEIPDDYEIEDHAGPLQPPTLALQSRGRQQSHPQKLLASQQSISQLIPKSLEEEMADEVARQEEAELQAYLEMIEQEEMEAQQEAQPQQQHSSQYSPQPHIHEAQQAQQQQNVPHIQASASDEIDYDKMFEDMNMDGQDTGIPDDEDMMDMS